MATTLTCANDLKNLFSRAQHQLASEFNRIDGIKGVWEGRIRNGGTFPVGSGFAARTTMLGFQRPRHSTIRWQPKVGLQDDCVVSCNTPSNKVTIQNADHKWYRVFEYAEHTEPYCLHSMWADALNLPDQIRNIVMNLKARSVEMMDEFYRANQVALSANKWVGVDDGSNSGRIRKGLWRFETDANGSVNINKIILDPSIEPENVGLASIDTLNWIRETGSYTGAFPIQGNTKIITDYETASLLPKYDTNVRADNRYRAPGTLDPSLAGVMSYGGYDFDRDPFIFRYYWDENDDNYPNGVLTRIDHWSSQPVSEGCWDDVSTDYMNADFQLTIPFNNLVWMLQNYQVPNPPDMPYEQPHSPYNGMWQFFNEVNEITPCNSQRNLAYWQMILAKAAKPDRYDLGHVLLHRRFNSRGVFKSCRSLTVPVAGSYNCTITCPPLDHYAPALVTRTVCGKWNEAGATCGS
jgi:hypothetical protein